MAKGDITPSKWLQKALTTTATDSTIAGAAGVRRYVTSVTACLQTGVTSRRTVSVYLGGTAASNEILRIPLDPSGDVAQVVTQLPYFLEAGETMYFKQDLGTDVNIEVLGAVEELT